MIDVRGILRSACLVRMLFGEGLTYEINSVDREPWNKR